jgi:hypothetical protein
VERRHGEGGEPQRPENETIEDEKQQGLDKNTEIIDQLTKEPEEREHTIEELTTMLEERGVE